MKLDYFYKKTKRIKKVLQELIILKKVIDLLPKLPHLEENLKRESLLKSSLFSAKIEGNKLELRDIKYSSLKNSSLKSPKTLAKLEIFNILKGLNFIYSKKAPKKLTKNFILKLHQIVLSGISPSAGCLRKEPSAIFNQAGVAVYLPPPADQVNSLLNELIKKNNFLKENGLVKAAIFHFIFEKVHPFLDGNGRVGRLISTFILKNGGYSFRGLISFEEYLEENRPEYYDLLNLKNKDMTEFVEFFLEAIKNQAEKVMKKLKATKKEKPEDILLPRRREILEIIKDHPYVSFDFIKRRFLKIPKSTLHYDLRQLQKGKFIKKLGSTRGTVYAIF